jgi:ATP-dependent Clp protease ATP-binding subunit ClpC
VIVFNSLEKEHLHKIIDITLSKVFDRILALGYKIELTNKAKDFLSEKGYDPQYGARPLNRAIQKHLEDPLAEEILNGDVSEGDTLVADLQEKDQKIVFKKKGPKKSEVSKEDEKKDN